MFDFSSRALRTIAPAVALTLGVSLAADARTLVLGHGAAPGNPRTMAADLFAELVHDYTDGSLDVQIQGSEQLGSDVEMLDQVLSGQLDLTANSQGPLANIVPEANVFGLPFLFDSPQAAWEVVDGELGDRVADLTEERGLKVLAWWDNGIRHITNNARPIEQPEDVDGLKIRTPEDAMTISIFEELGANPTPLAFGELYTALRQGTVDGQENPLVNIWSSKLHEVQDYLSLTGHKYEVTPFIVGMQTWQSLSADEQAAVERAAQEAGAYQRMELVRQSADLGGRMEEAGVAINEADVAAFREATQPVYDHWRERLGDIVDLAQEAAADNR
ncbi:TRAP transporter substrate-binding protein [Sediminicurvatus halobius]|uniref:C4-dicarboxylate ABC transporter n=1 Tax=Sediminicurvatus halobius TaxID=2182432 RepID=A0A2U2N9N2_9GAMM|nr:TRAP transporter substrate-binding protein [Spiribacter halobius]PWG65797.1 C4-dicarboxylate ABC transporter [Spiribacter halobius]UEX77839.1 TRAP transporter substrate-binding protein [Spiribacter halobius]